jgi:putative two-component system response regulator
MSVEAPAIDPGQREYKASRILMIDDEPVNLKLLERALKSNGYDNFRSVQDSRQAVEEFLLFDPDLLLLDINMPHIDGFGVLEQIRALNAPLKAPVMVLTAQGSRDRLVRAFDLGARDFLQKPFDILELMVRVRNLLELHHSRKSIFEHNARLEDTVRQRTHDLRNTQLQVVQRLGRAAEYRDNETGFHILRMSHISALLARAIGMSASETEILLHASPMHDIGKIGIPDAILLKPGNFTPPEWEIMKTHSAIGAAILESPTSPLLEMAGVIALNHHEKWDGTGYPGGLVGNTIPLVGRIAALADVFDALTSERPYKSPWPLGKACDYIREGAGSHFDPDLVRIFFEQLPPILEISHRYAEPVSPSSSLAPERR